MEKHDLFLLYQYLKQKRQALKILQILAALTNCSPKVIRLRQFSEAGKVAARCYLSWLGAAEI